MLAKFLSIIRAERSAAVPEHPAGFTSYLYRLHPARLDDDHGEFVAFNFGSSAKLGIADKA